MAPRPIGDHRIDDDHYQQPGDLFRKMSPTQREVLFANTARQIGGAAKHIQERHIINCTKADPAYGAGVARAIASLNAKVPADDHAAAGRQRNQR
jgi:catalase